ncbi:MAG TPA: trypsin-like serine protease [Polyangiaceae bacterium]
MRARSFPRFLPLVLVSVLVACSSAAGPGAPESTGQSVEPIINGTVASAYPEAALIDIYQGGQLMAYCSGSLISPEVVLTAGHCVKGENGSQGTLTPDGWAVHLPYNGGQSFTASGATVYDWPQTDGTVDPNYHDIGLVFLGSPANVTAADCPVLASSPVASQSNVVNIGRIQNGNLSTTNLYVSAPVAVLDGASAGYNYDYVAQDVIEQGDSGGPDEVPGTTPHEIVAVNSGGGSDEVLARVDLLYSWILQQISAHGGQGACTELVADAGGSSSGSSGASSSGGGSSSGSASSSGSTGSSSGSASGSGSGGSGSGSGSSSGNQGTGSSSGVSTTPADGGAKADAAFGGPSGCGCVVVSADGGAGRGGLAALGLLALGLIGRRRRT